MVNMPTQRIAKKQSTKNLQQAAKKAPLLEELRNADLTKVALFLGMGVDPDGLASQAMMETILLEKLDAQHVDCFYRGSFNRPENKIARKVLSLNPKQEDDFSQEPYTCVISLDGPTEACPVQPDFIIDHHEPSEVGAKVASDIRLVGACSSIMWEYALETEFDFTTENGQRLATALALGIKTDTIEGSSDKSCNLDYEALAYCLTHKDNKLYKEVVRHSRPQYYRDLYVAGWNNKIIEGTTLVTGIGSIPTSRSGVISYLADEFVDTEGVTTAVIFAIVDGAIDISIRSKNAAINVQEFVRNAFGGGGGRPGAGRISIPTPLFKNIPEELSKDLFESCFKIVKHKALQIAGDKK
jgi:nanoRNase/pAp phosphatase (c-di-AMP/oligoRNAs hydrolase)